MNFDWLIKPIANFFGGVGNAVNNIVQGPSRGQSPVNFVQNIARPRPQQPVRRVQSAPQVDLGRVLQFLKGNPNANPIVKGYQDLGRGIINTGRTAIDMGLNPIKYQQQAVDRLQGDQKKRAQAALDVAKFLPNAYLPRFTKDIAVGTAQSVAQAPVRTALEINKVVAPKLGLSPIKEVRPTNAVTRALLGNDTVGDFASYGRSLPLVGDKLGALAAPVGIALTAGDVAFGGEGKTIKALSTASNTKAIAGILKADKYLNKLPDNIVKGIVPALARTQDPKIVRQILRDATSSAQLPVANITRGIAGKFAPNRANQIAQGVIPDNLVKTPLTKLKASGLVENGKVKPVLHLPQSGAHVEVTPKQLQYLVNETQNIPFNKDGIIHLSSSPKVRQSTQAISMAEARSQNPVLDQLMAKINGEKVGKPIYETVPKEVLDQLNAAEGKKVRGFVKQVQGSQSSTPEVAGAVQGLYTPKSNRTLLTQARQNISSDIMGAERVATTKVTDEGVATASELIKHYQALGQYDKAVDVAQKAAKNLTEAGRTVQAASLYSRISPEGILRYTQAQIDKAGGQKLAPEVAKRLTEMARSVQAMADGEEKAYAVAKLQQEIARQIPTGILNKLTTLRKAGLLTGLRTQAGNAVSNLSHIGLNKISDIPAAGVDAMMSLFTKERTKVFTTRGLVSGGAEGGKKAAKFLRTGVDELGLGANKYDFTPVNFKNPVVQKYVDTVFNTMGAADKPYRYAAFKNQLYDLAIAEAKNRGLRGKQAGTFIKKFVEEPSPEAAQTAMSYAEKSVFANDTALSQAATGIRRSLENKSPVAAAAIDVIMPFTKVPSAVITRLFDYTPVGAVKEAAKQIKSGAFNQRSLAQAIGESATGTGTIFLGAALAANGQITGPMPTDQRERDLWQLEGKQPNAIRFGDKWYSFNYTSPVGQLLQVGSQIADGAKQGASALSAIGSGVLGGAKAVVDQSYLQGVQGILEAINDPKRYAENFLKSNAGSVVPTLVADVARAMDPLQRETNSIPEAIKARIPGLRQGLLPKQDAFGAPQQRQGSPLESMVDPFRATKAVDNNPLTQELRRLQDANQGITPNADSKKDIQVGNKKYPLTPDQVNSLNTATGQATQQTWSQAINDPNYASLGDDSKKNVLQNMYADINAVEKYKLMMQTGNSEAAQALYDKLTKNQMLYLQNGSLDVQSYISKQLPKSPKVKISAKKAGRKVSSGRSVRKGRAPKAPRVKLGKVPTSNRAPKLRAVRSTYKAPKVASAKRSRAKVKLA